MRGVILDRNSLGDADLTPLTSLLEGWDIHGSTVEGKTVERIQHCEVVLTNKVVLDQAVIAASPSLRFIGIMATGTNNVDLEAAREREIVVCNARGYATNSVAQHTIGLMLNLATQQHRYIADTGANRWQESDVFCRLDYPMIELAGKTLGIIGLGELGSAVAKLGQALGMTVLALRSENGAESAEVTRVSMETLLDKADFLSLHCPLTEANTGLVDASFLAQMKPSAFLINTARGGLIQTDALLNALDQGLIRGAAIDVLTKEPAAQDEPLLARPRSNLIVTPHNAWGASESRARLIDQLCENLGAWQAGAPIRWVNP